MGCGAPMWNKLCYVHTVSYYLLRKKERAIDMCNNHSRTQVKNSQPPKSTTSVIVLVQRSLSDRMIETGGG